jgi:hypothetical protein
MTTADAKVELVALAECPIGLFWSDYGTLCLKTEYGNNEGRIDAYIIESGEFYWGPAPQTIASQRASLVRPIDTDFATAALEASHSLTEAIDLGGSEIGFMDDEPEVLHRNIFAEITAKAQPLCEDESDPERVTGYRLPVGPLHRAAGEFGFQMFDGEAHLSAAAKRIAELEAELTAMQDPRPIAPETEQERCAFCNYPAGAHSDICVAWHTQHPTPIAPVQDDDAEWLRNYGKNSLLSNGVQRRFRRIADRLANRLGKQSLGDGR